jgi:hypothetical protein
LAEKRIKEALLQLVGDAGIDIFNMDKDAGGQGKSQ